jgi:hypothetical protein
MNNLYEVLEICLQEIEQGADIDTVLFRYPELADELRPILEASVNARRIAVPAPSQEVLRRNRARVLQHAAQMREVGARRSSQRAWLVSLRRVAVTLVVVAMLFISGTNLVRAASTTLPGDNLYPVKRTWEDVLLLLTFNTQQREALEIEHENERLHELRELFAEGRAAEVDFAGVVTSQTGNEWVVSGVPVRISSETEVRDPVAVGSPVRVRGETLGDGVVLAERVRLLSPDDKLPAVELEDDDENESQNDNSGKGSGDEMPEIENADNSGSETESKGDLLDDNNSAGNDNSGSGSKNDSTRDDNQNDGSNSGSGSDDNHIDSNDDSSGGRDHNSGSGGGDD